MEALNVYIGSVKAHLASIKMIRYVFLVFLIMASEFQYPNFDILQLSQDKLKLFGNKLNFKMRKT